MNRSGLWVVIIAAAVLIVAGLLYFKGRPQWPGWPEPGTGPSSHKAGNLYRDTGPGRLSAAVAGALARVYVPDVQSGDVTVIDPATLKVVDRLRVGANPQHVVPSWDLRTLWVTGSLEDHRHGQGSLTPIDPRSAKAGSVIPVPDAYNLYFTYDGRAAIVVAEEERSLEFRDPQTMQLRDTLHVPECDGINHADFSTDGSYAIFSCEFGHALVKIDMGTRRVLGRLTLSKNSMPQDVRAGPDGETFYVADMLADGVYVIDGNQFGVVGFISTGTGAHGLCVSRDGRSLYVSNRGAHSVHGPPHGPGSISVIDFSSRKVVRTWPIPGGGSPDMGNVSADGKQLWVSGRFDDVAYRIDTITGAVASVPVGREPHGLAVWPQPGRFSLGHTGNMR